MVHKLGPSELQIPATTFLLRINSKYMQDLFHSSLMLILRSESDTNRIVYVEAS